jgi:hypothetical protein
LNKYRAEESILTYLPTDLLPAATTIWQKAFLNQRDGVADRPDNFFKTMSWSQCGWTLQPLCLSVWIRHATITAWLMRLSLIWLLSAWGRFQVIIKDWWLV